VGFLMLSPPLPGTGGTVGHPYRVVSRPVPPLSPGNGVKWDSGTKRDCPILSHLSHMGSLYDHSHPPPGSTNLDARKGSRARPGRWHRLCTRKGPGGDPDRYAQARAGVSDGRSGEGRYRAGTWSLEQGGPWRTGAMQIRVKRRGRRVYRSVVEHYRCPATGKPRELMLESLGRCATVAEAVKQTEEGIGWLRVLKPLSDVDRLALEELGRRRALLAICRKAGLA
jgi:hypothetical protein